jgi:uncharacterized protein (DUF697 family)/tellurite resistance protein
MNPNDAQTVMKLAALAAAADGTHSDAERASLASTMARLGVTTDAGNVDATTSLEALVQSLSDDEARLAAYDVAAAVCQVDGPANAAESAFLARLSSALGAVPGRADTDATLDAVAAAGTSPGTPAQGDATAYILDQAMLTAACELLPHKLSAMAILPLQLRMVYAIGQRAGQEFDMSQAKDLVAVLGIGVAGHAMEGIVRGVLGSLGRGLLGGLLGRATGAAAGVAVTFATTYALGHAAQQYYAQGRTLSMADMKALFSRLQGEANTLYPKVESRIRELAAGTSLDRVLAGLRR